MSRRRDCICGIVLLVSLLGLPGCSSSKTITPQECDINEDCAQGYKCVEDGGKHLCRDIYHPNVLPPQTSVR